MNISSETVVALKTATIKDQPGYVNQTSLFAEAGLDKFHNHFGYLSYNPAAKTATFLKGNRERINIKGITPDGKVLFTISDSKHDHAKQHISDTGNLIAFTRTDNGMEQLCLFNRRSGEVLIIDSRHGDYSLFTFVNNEQELRYRFSSAEEGGNIYACRLTNGSIAKLSQYENPFVFPLAERLSLGGIPCFLHKPPNYSNSSKYPAVVFLHGGPCEPCSMQWIYYLMAFAAEGFIVIRPNVRGNWGNGRRHLYSIEGKSGILDADDAITVCQEAAKLECVDKNRVHLVGESYGGYVAAMAATRQSTAFKTVSLFAGIFDLSEFAKTRGEIWDIYPYSIYFGKLSEISDVLNERSPIRHANEINYPIFLLHGKSDPQVPHNQSQAFADKLKSAGKKVEVYENLNTHGGNAAQARTAWCTAVVSFWKRHY
jgi:dipeptidyl aminopeptidase/acylaminoacyl peptidase